MFHLHTGRTSLLSFFLSLFLFVSSFPVVAAGSPIPVLSENRKTGQDAPSRTMSSKQVSGTPILGKPQDISRVKKANPHYFVKREKKSINRNLSARCAIIIDGLSGRTLYSKNPDTPRQPASTIKIITGMIAIKSLKNHDKVAVSSKAAKQPRSKVYLDQHKKYLANDLINAVLLASANDASVALAEKIAGSERDFAKMMTLRARLWGAQHTVCKTATGLTAKGQSSTARDLALIFRHVMNDKEFASRMKRVTVKTTDGKTLHNHNKALWQLHGTEGGKTGYTRAARQTYVGKFKRGSDEIIVALMGSEKMWTDLKTLVDYGFTQKKIAASSQRPILLAKEN
ncbi:MAG: D-alanyl-D-alanine carboxypeptidase [Deltaproteobacteria bacterium]|nr:MAG: D-alanyl-D-alanine carboxypeptidase [Deltaproteobacteria bacterium]